MTTRILAALVALPLVIVPVYVGGVWCTLLFVAVALLAGFEFYNLMDTGDYRPMRWVGLVWLVPLVLSGAQPDWFPFPRYWWPASSSP